MKCKFGQCRPHFLFFRLKGSVSLDSNAETHRTTIYNSIRTHCLGTDGVINLSLESLRGGSLTASWQYTFVRYFD